MKVSANQPYFIPYIGYWQLIKCSDVFLVCDDYNYIKGGWINRNRILNGKEPAYCNLTLDKASQNKMINETFIKDIDIEKQLRSLECTYRKSPNFKDGYELMNKILSCPERNLSLFLENSIKVMAEYLDIDTKIMRTSDFEGNNLLKREFRIYDFCERLGADTYINAVGGMELYDFEEFEKHGLQLEFLKTNDIRYKQFDNDFVESLSIIDVIMFNSREEVLKMMEEYTLVKKEQ
ncbi:MAG: WbqC family protein [Paludibacteraceae bacterium]|nr:WbqC family protein [Paludibacteraceae bacterium]